MSVVVLRRRDVDRDRAGDADAAGAARAGRGVGLEDRVAGALGRLDRERRRLPSSRSCRRTPWRVATTTVTAIATPTPELGSLVWPGVRGRGCAVLGARVDAVVVGGLRGDRHGRAVGRLDVGLGRRSRRTITASAALRFCVTVGGLRLPVRLAGRTCDVCFERAGDGRAVLDGARAAGDARERRGVAPGVGAGAGRAVRGQACPMSANPPVVATVTDVTSRASGLRRPSSMASCVGLFAVLSLSVAPLGLESAVVGAALSCRPRASGSCR